MSIIEVDVLHRRAKEFAQNFYYQLEGRLGTGIDWFLENKDSYFRMYSTPNLKITFLNIFLTAFSKLVEEHEPACTSPEDCTIMIGLTDINRIVKVEIEKIEAVIKANATAMKQKESQLTRVNFLKKAWQSAVEYLPAAPYSVQIDTEEIGQELGIGRELAVRFLKELGDLGYVKNLIGAKGFFITTEGAFFLENSQPLQTILSAGDDLKKQIREAVGKNKLSAALDLLKVHFEKTQPDKDFLHSAIVLISRFERVRQSEITGTSTESEVSIERNKISKAVLELSAEIE